MCCILNGMQVITSRVARLPDKEPCTIVHMLICMYVHYVFLNSFLPQLKISDSMYLIHFTNFCKKWCISVRLGAITKYETTTLAFSQKNISNSNCEQCVAHWHWENVHECSSMNIVQCSWIRILRRGIHSHSFHHD